MKDRRRKHAATRMREMWRKETIRALGQHDRCSKRRLSDVLAERQS